MAERLSDTKTRNYIALVTTVVFFGGPALLLLGRVLGVLQNEDIKELLGMWTTYFGTPAGAIFGYYFGTSGVVRRGG